MTQRHCHLVKFSQFLRKHTRSDKNVFVQLFQHLTARERYNWLLCIYILFISLLANQTEIDSFWLSSQVFHLFGFSLIYHSILFLCSPVEILYGKQSLFPLGSKWYKGEKNEKEIRSFLIYTPTVVPTSWRKIFFQNSYFFFFCRGYMADRRASVYISDGVHSGARVPKPTPPVYPNLYTPGL